MQVGSIENTSRVIGKQQGFYGLPVRDDWEKTQPRRVELIQQAREVVKNRRHTIAPCSENVADLLRALADALSMLPIADGHENDSVTGPETPTMTTAWLPTPGELVALNAGAAVHVKLIGRQHPPIMVNVGPLPL